MAAVTENLRGLLARSLTNTCNKKNDHIKKERSL